MQGHISTSTRDGAAARAAKHSHEAAGGKLRGDERRVLTATLVGTAIEWYDYFIYAQAAALVLGPLFFAPLKGSNPGMEAVISFATIGISFLFRPLGAIVAGPFTLADLLTVGWLFVAWLGIGWITEHPPRNLPSVSVVMKAYRREWMRH